MEPRRPSVTSIATCVAALLVGAGCGSREPGGPITGNWQPREPSFPLSGDAAPGATDDGATSGLPTPDGCSDDAQRGWSAMRAAPIPAAVSLERVRLVWTGTTVVLVGEVVDRAAPRVRRGVFFAYDVATDAWTTLAGPPWGTSVRDAQAVAFDGRVFVWSGDGAAILDLGRGPGAESWTSIPKPPPSVLAPRRVSPHLVWSTTTRELIVWGGSSEVGEPLADGAALDPAWGTWRRIADAPVRARVAPVAWDGASMVILGGRERSCAHCGLFDDGASYDPAGDTWRRLATEVAFGRRGTEVALPVSTESISGALFFGGVYGDEGDAGTREDGVVLDRRRGTFEYVPAPQAGVLRPAHTRSGFAAWMGAGRFWLWGGAGARTAGSADEPFGDGASFDFATGTWAPLPDGGPTPRADAAAVWTGCEAIVYGGRRGEVRLGDGAILRP